MARLYPPRIEGKLPAFTYTEGDQQILITIPYQLNPAVSRIDFNRMSITIKTVQTSHVLLNNFTNNDTDIYFDTNSNETKVRFAIPTSKFKPLIGQFYKIQIAFVDKDSGETGYFSSVGIIKCTSLPKMYIEGLSNENLVNPHRFSYTGVYSQEGTGKDIAEKVYSYKFDLFDEYNQLVATSGILLHNSSLDQSRHTSQDTWVVEKELKQNHPYRIQYSVKTINGYEPYPVSYNIMSIESIDMNSNLQLLANMNKEEGYVDIKLYNATEAIPVIGHFVISRSSSEDDFQSWPEIYRFTINGNLPNGSLWKDFTVEQGKEYKYCIQAYNTNAFYSNRREAIYENQLSYELYGDSIADLIKKPRYQNIYADFEHAFLYDGEKQLKIEYNPKVTSLKATVLENKVNTLGGKYPFIFRNGDIYYKEFSVSGLLSYQSDRENLFMTDSYESNEERIRTSAELAMITRMGDLTAENFAKERKFKLEALEWLTNGKPKLFRSPGEGNYIVRLTNSSLSPIDTLGRMLHSFSTNATEIAECNFTNLDKYGFISRPTYGQRQMKFGQLSLEEVEWLLPANTYLIYISEEYQGNVILDFTYADGYSTGPIQIANSTGEWRLPTTDIPVVAINKISGTFSPDAKALIGYYDDETIDDSFGYINGISTSSDTAFIIGYNEQDAFEGSGYVYDTMSNNNYKTLAWKTIQTDDGIAQVFDYETAKYEFDRKPNLTNFKFEPVRFYSIEIKPRDLITIYKNPEDGLYYDGVGSSSPITYWSDSTIYRVWNVDGTARYYSGKPIEPEDSHNRGANELAGAPVYKAKINNDSFVSFEKYIRTDSQGQLGDMELAATQTYFKHLDDIEKLDSLILGTGVTATLSYQIRSLHFTIEENDNLKAWLKYIEKLEEKLQLLLETDMLNFTPSPGPSGETEKEREERIALEQEEWRKVREQHNQDIIELTYEIDNARREYLVRLNTELENQKAVGVPYAV